MPDYNKTIHLPKTEFPMRAALAKREPGMLEEFQRKDIYRKLMQKNEGKPRFVLHDGPRPCQEYDRLPGPLYPRLGHPRHAH